MRWVVALAAAGVCVGVAGCPADDGPGGSAEGLCPTTPAGGVAVADANGDGGVDLADAVWILRHVADGGPAPVCTVAADLTVDGRLEVDDAFAVLQHLYEDTFALPEVRARDCADAEPAASPACGAGAVSLIPPVASSGPGEVIVRLAGSTLPVEGWSVGLTADGCTFTGATVEGTAGAPAGVDPGGQRRLGYALARHAGRDAAAAVLLDTRDAVTLDGAVADLLRVTLEAGGACGTCTVSLDPARVWGQRVAALLVARGASYPLPAASVAFELCP